MGAPSLTNAFCLLLRFKTFIILLGVAGSVTRKRSRHRGCQINSYLSTSVIKREMNGAAAVSDWYDLESPLELCAM